MPALLQAEYTPILKPFQVQTFVVIVSSSTIATGLYEILKYGSPLAHQGGERLGGGHAPVSVGLA
jgi:hypothetical protein